MRRRSSNGAICLLCGALVAASGCGDSSQERTVLPAMVRGRVMLDGEPLTHGTVTFFPQEARDGAIEPGFASIEEDGGYWVGNANLSKPAGLEPGRYKVTVLVMNPRPDGPEGAIAQLAVPSRYIDEATTPLIFDIRAGQNQVRIDLVSQPPPTP